MNIVKLTSENIKRIEAVEVTPSGEPVIVIGGRNGQGKSSLLDSIAMALGGKDLIPKQPIRLGQDHAKVTVDLGEYVITRTFTKNGGGILTVSNKEGARFSSPQALLDKITGNLTFDPAAFERMSPKDQFETLRKLAGVNLASFDEQEARLVSDRLVDNKLEKQLDAQVAGCRSYPDAPAHEVSVTALMEELARAEDSVHVLDAAKNNLYVATNNQAAHENKITSLESRKDALLKEIEAVDAQLKPLYVNRECMKVSVDEHCAKVTLARSNVIPTDPIKAQIANADTVNKTVRAQQRYLELTRQLDVIKQKNITTQQRIDAVRDERKRALQQAALPIPGLGLNDGVVTFGGIPFEQASTAERLRISVAIGLAMNPTLKVLLIRDGSCLDSHSLKSIAAQAEAAGAQVWIEKVAESSKGVTVLIEEGRVVAQKEEAVA